MPDLPKGHLAEQSLLDLLRDSIVRDEVNSKTLKSLVHHMADLAVLEAQEGGHWKISGTDSIPSNEWGNVLVQRLSALCREEKGFALKFFVKNPPDNPPPSLFELEPKGHQGSLSEGLVSPEGRLLAEKSSNLSNLQIVKKTGRQLSPLIELETRCLEKLQGPLTTRQDARQLFNFVIGQMKEKGIPRPWEQLSRRRHK